MQTQLQTVTMINMEIVKLMKARPGSAKRMIEWFQKKKTDENLAQGYCFHKKTYYSTSKN